LAEIVVIAPVLGRPQNAQPLADSLLAATQDRARLIFVASETDEEQCTACFHVQGYPVGVVLDPGPPAGGDYAEKIQLGYDATDEPLVLLAADDLVFHPGWLEAVLAVANQYDAGVIGTNDTANPQVVAGLHSTHPVVRRCYIDSRGGYVGAPGKVYWQGFDHNCCDVELVQTAIARGCYYHAHDAVVEHRHPLWGTAAWDATYHRGRAQAGPDTRLLESRRRVWLAEGRA
jgi:hypothetical protein